MTEFLEILLSYPTVVFTVLASVALLYWILVIVGALDLELFDPSGLFHGVDGAVDGALHGAGEGAAEAAGGAVEGALHGAADGAAEGAAHSLDASDLHHVGEAAGLLSALGLRGIPVTVIASVTLLFGWALCGTGMQLLEQWLPGSLWQSPLRWLLGTAVGLVSAAAGLLVASLALRPFRFAVRTEQGRSRLTLIGLTGVVTTSRVDAGFGQAEVHADGDYILVDVRCDEENELRRGSLVLLFEHDATNELFHVVPHREE